MNFFNLHLNNKNYSADDIINIDEKIYFQNVHLFIVSFKNVAHIKTDEVIHHNLNKYLWNIVQDWYIDQLFFIEREYICEKLNVKCWKKMLFHHFKCTQFNPIKMLKIEQYIIQDVQNNWKSSDFVLNIIHHTKNADMINISVQLIWM